MKKVKLLFLSLCVLLCMISVGSYVTEATPVLAASSSSSSTKIDVSKLKIKLSATKYTYNGKEKKPKITVTYKGKTVSEKNYTVKYSSGRKLPGTYKVTVTFKGNYSGKKTLSYKISVQAPVVEYTLSSNEVELTWDDTKKSTGYLVYDGDKELIEKTKVSLSVIDELKAGTKYTFYVRSYVKINGKNYYSSFSKAQFATKPKISGTKNLYVGDSKTFKATATGKVTWSSSDKSIATVSSKGKVTAVKAGTVKIKAKVNGVTASYKLTVKKPSIKLNKSAITLKLDETAKLKATVTPSDMDIKWKSSDTDIVEVSSSGELIPMSVGTATVTATGKYAGKTYKKTCKVTIEMMDIVIVEYVDWTKDSVGGIAPEITLTNNTDYDIKYMKILTSYKNKFGDPVYCDIYNEDTALLNVRSGLYAHETKTFYWDVILYNEWVSRVDVDAIEITFVDGTVVTQEFECGWYDSDYYYQ